MESCWDISPEDRPSFEELLNRLTAVLNCPPPAPPDGGNLAMRSTSHHISDEIAAMTEDIPADMPPNVPADIPSDNRAVDGYLEMT